MLETAALTADINCGAAQSPLSGRQPLQPPPPPPPPTTLAGNNQIFSQDFQLEGTLCGESLSLSLVMVRQHLSHLSPQI